MEYCNTDRKLGLSRKLVVRLAKNQSEIENTLALRYNVFNLELGEGLSESRETQKDQDEYDYFCDHLIVEDQNNNNSIVGTYRILRSSVAKKTIGFYSENEFDLSNLYLLKEEIAEVGRSCVRKDYRDGSVISLLWSGFGQYMNKHNIRYLFGCGSIHSIDPILVSQVYAFLRENGALVQKELTVYPSPNHQLPGFDSNYHINNFDSIRKQIPPLIKGYVRLGAKICGYPALDKGFGTTDFFVLFDKNTIDYRYGTHYLRSMEL
ncbi:GNAT family N-acetyltransferase [Leptospira vanthielii]|uniref:GNAT family N-acetyltransferase n=2 Tax=Leptospira vanthielii TaxID=293085 RepID=A0ABY2NQS4_9LEPT|nr:GNAT family N-acyltransferase [Leptospira vanthielii]EMY69865.1 acetyltransferase (GNAT) domain protein [Leptospira vanthielii serovar Holland str. Waz Holland = ATCC 700522]TGM58235.1 GNAT family N-acetyltransferase [Leptospira vanthielii]